MKKRMERRWTTAFCEFFAAAGLIALVIFSRTPAAHAYPQYADRDPRPDCSQCHSDGRGGGQDRANDSGQADNSNRDDGDRDDSDRDDSDREDGDRDDSDREDGDREDGDREDGDREDGDREDGDRRDSNRDRSERDHRDHRSQDERSGHHGDKTVMKRSAAIF